MTLFVIFPGDSIELICKFRDRSFQRVKVSEQLLTAFKYI